jgi:hypothetical protein
MKTGGAELYPKKLNLLVLNVIGQPFCGLDLAVLIVIEPPNPLSLNVIP